MVGSESTPDNIKDLADKINGISIQGRGGNSSKSWSNGSNGSTTPLLKEEISEKINEISIQSRGGISSNPWSSPSANLINGHRYRSSATSNGSNGSTTPLLKEEISEKINEISIQSRGGSSSKSWNSPSSNLINGHRYRSSATSNGSNGSTAPLLKEEGGNKANGLSEVKRKKDFRCMERVNGRLVNVLEGLELHTGVFSIAEQQKIVEHVYELQDQGRKGQLRERTYSEPRKWMRGKGRVTLQFGCCYNYATDKNGNPPGIIRDEEVDPIPPLLKSMIKRMVEWRVLPASCVPNSCIVNIYDVDDCIPPHIDHHDFVRPFCTVSFLSECDILFGANLKVLGPGEFSGSTAIPLPMGSVLILNGNGADVAKHCVPAVPSRRISITFRKMDDSKLPFRFTPGPELRNLRPLSQTSNPPPIQQLQRQTPPSHAQRIHSTPNSESSKDQSGSKKNQSAEKSAGAFQLGNEDFPSLGSSNASKPMRKPGRSLRQ